MLESLRARCLRIPAWAIIVVLGLAVFAYLVTLPGDWGIAAGQTTVCPTPTPGGVPGDANNDGHVAFDDFFILIDNWGKTGCGNPADFNHDGMVGFPDFFILIDNWGK